MLEIYCGNGKGKTTAAMGLAFRALGRGKNVYILQFLKGDNSGELEAFAAFPQAMVAENPKQMKFLFQMTPEEKELCRQDCIRRFQEASVCIRSQHPFVVVMDELLDAIECGLVPEDEVLELISQCKGDCEFVLTGRRYSPAMEAQADYITRMEKVKHPYDQGAAPRAGIEF